MGSPKVQPQAETSDRFEKLAQVHGNTRHGGAGEPRTGAVQRAFRESPLTRLAMELHLLLRPEHQPAFLYSSAGIRAKLGAVIVRAAHADFDYQFGGARMREAEISTLPAHDGKVRLRLGVCAGDGLLCAHHKARGHKATKKVLRSEE